jgi:hypothetical protein
MEKNSNSISKKHQTINKKIARGLKISFRNLVQEKALKDEELVFELESKIKFVKAKKIRVL